MCCDLAGKSARNGVTQTTKVRRWDNSNTGGATPTQGLS